MSGSRSVYYRAAGGVVVDRWGHVLLLERDVVRDGRPVHEVRLPKGHVEPGESDEEAALREVCEESGYCDLLILADLGTARSEFDFEGRHIVRDEHYFLMGLKSPTWSGQRTDPTKEEALFRVTWVKDLATAQRMLSYESEREFARRAQSWLEKQPWGAGP